VTSPTGEKTYRNAGQDVVSLGQAFRRRLKLEELDEVFIFFLLLVLSRGSALRVRSRCKLHHDFDLGEIQAYLSTIWRTTGGDPTTACLVNTATVFGLLSTAHAPGRPSVRQNHS
jgi:hypothetical protein